MRKFNNIDLLATKKAMVIRLSYNNVFIIFPLILAKRCIMNLKVINITDSTV